MGGTSNQLHWNKSVTWAVLADLESIKIFNAEIQVKSEQFMTMKDWIGKLDEYLAFLGKGVLKNAGIISADKAEEKADQEYEIYKKDQDKNYISDFDRKIKKLSKIAKKFKMK